jgi:hypothetical protein
MRWIEPGALRAALQFPIANARMVLAGAGLYGVVFAVQSVLTLYLAAGSSAAGLGALIATLAAFGVFCVVLAGWGRVALGMQASTPLGFQAGGDELRLIWVAFLVVILSFTITGTAGLVLLSLFIALTMVGAARAGITAQPEQLIDTFALFGTGEWIVAGVGTVMFLVFNIWLFSRLSLGVPATLDGRRVRILSVWPLSTGRFVAITLSAAAVIFPGLVMILMINSALGTLFGIAPASPQSLVNANGDMTGSPLGLAAISFVYGGLKMVLLGAPLTGLVCALYRIYARENAHRLETDKTRQL